jgi:hypothetical protein
VLQGALPNAVAMMLDLNNDLCSLFFSLTPQTIVNQQVGRRQSHFIGTRA